MSYPGVKAVSGVLPQSETMKVQSSIDPNLERGKQRLLKATNEFESLFMYEMLKTMRQTVLKNSLSEKGPFSNDLGKETFTQMFDMELARKMSTGKDGSISAILYNSLKKVIEPQHSPDHSGAKVEGLGQKSRKLIPLNRERLRLSMPSSQPMSISRKSNEFSTIDRSKHAHSTDRILKRFGRYIDEAAQQTGLDSTLIYAVIKTESDGDPRAVSTAGAKGLMQLIDSTAKDYRVSDVFDPRENILAGCTYLKHLLDRFGDVRLALAAYNAGPQHVVKHHGLPPFRETKDYVNRVIDIFTSFQRTLRSHDTKGALKNVR
jgi:Rod binding domain-containing protein